MEIKAEDKTLIEAYFNWCRAKKCGYPQELECSRLIVNMDSEHRWLVEAFLAELEAKDLSEKS